MNNLFSVKDQVVVITSEPGGAGRRGGLPCHSQIHRLRRAGQPAPVQHGNLRRVQTGKIR